MKNTVQKDYGGNMVSKMHLNLTVDWYDKDYLGLDQGPILIMIENYRTGLIWKSCDERSNHSKKAKATRL